MFLPTFFLFCRHLSIAIFEVEISDQAESKDEEGKKHKDKAEDIEDKHSSPHVDGGSPIVYADTFKNVSEDHITIYSTFQL